MKNTRRTTCLVLSPIGLFLLASLAGPVRASDGADAADKSGETRSGIATDANEAVKAEISASRAAIEVEIKELRDRLQIPEQAAEIATQLEAELALLERIDSIEARRSALIGRRAAFDRSEAAIDRKLAAGAAADISKSPPYPLALLDLLGDALDGQQARQEVLEDAQEAARAALANAREKHKRSEVARRRAFEAAETAEDIADEARARATLHVEELRERLAKTRIGLAKLELETTERDVLLNQKTEAVTLATLRFVEERLELSQELRDAALAGLEQEEFELQQAREAAALDLERAHLRLLAAEQRRDAQDDPWPALLAELEALRAKQETLQLRIGGYGEQEERLTALREVRERRLQTLAGEAPAPEIRIWSRDMKRLLRDFERRGMVEEANRAQANATLAAVRKRAEGLARSDAQRRWLNEHVVELEARVDAYSEELADLEGSRRIVERTLAEMDRRSEQMTLLDRLQIAGNAVGTIWETELTAIDERPITVGKVVTALVVLILGLLASRLISRQITRITHKRMAVDEGASAAFGSLSYYVLVVFFVLLALRSANIPLTAFTILGGAFAIGIGFGSQTIISNFISGLILLVERPIKVSDMIEIDGTLGRVENIGLRSTRVRTFDNIHIIVPNSSFLEHNVVNWNLSDDIVRAQVDVGVAYGSPTREVEALLLRVAEEHTRVLDAPAPTVLFAAFGASSLDFRLYFWLHVRDLLDRRRIESDLRHAIDAILAEASIVIAFPQQDVHLDTSRPLQIELAGDRSDSGPPGRHPSSS